MLTSRMLWDSAIVCHTRSSEHRLVLRDTHHLGHTHLDCVLRQVDTRSAGRPGHPGVSIRSYLDASTTKSVITVTASRKCHVACVHTVPDGRLWIEV
ncbi:hypothetical protein VTO73DRAFT_6496 [Trametes versicolor]